MKTTVTFESSAFNTTLNKESYINDGCFGDDVLEWLREELNKRGSKADEPFAEDFGWGMYFTLPDGESYCILGSYRPEDEDGDPGLWIWSLRKNVNFLKTMFGGDKHVSPAARKAVHECFASNPEIKNIRWHEEDNFMKGKEELGVESPD